MAERRDGCTADGASRESLVIFTGPDAYITPKWYPGKVEHGREVPTWNYIAVHAYGALTLCDDPEWLLAHVTRLTDQSESGRSERWSVSDAPPDYFARELKAIVGLEMEVTRLDARGSRAQALLSPASGRRRVVVAAPTMDEGRRSTAQGRLQLHPRTLTEG